MNSEQKVYKVRLFRNGIIESEIRSSVDWEIRGFVVKFLPKRFNAIAVTAFLKGEADSGIIAERIWSEGGGWIAKLQLERCE